MIRTMITAAITQPEVRRRGLAGVVCGAGVAPDAPGLAGGWWLVGAGDPAPGEVRPGPLASNLLPNPPASIPRVAPPAVPGRSGGGGTGVRNSSGNRPDGAFDGALDRALDGALDGAAGGGE